ncbi:MAG TPA: hypothetical protein VGC41_12710, partial [Kofleriaceae bacterium]
PAPELAPDRPSFVGLPFESYTPSQVMKPAERAATATGMSSFATSSWTAVVIAIVIAGALIALGILV